MNKIAAIKDYKLNLRYDGPLSVSTGRNRFEKQWKNREMQWSAMLKRLQEPTRTQETLAEYKAMSKAQQDQVKDVGGFVGGSLKEGRRRSENVLTRQLVTLDADFAPAGLDGDLELLATYAYAVYSTHKHTPEKPRLRLLIPLDRPVTPDEYEAIARKLAEDIGIDYFDDTTYQPSRLMYWPSVAHDGEFLFHYEDLPWLKADEVLARYRDWTDTSYWPESSRTKEDRVKRAKKQGDPTEKSGLIGAFCRTYTVEEAIEKFLPEIYIKCEMPDRYTYAEGSTAAGLVIYDSGKFAYSNHATDPASGKLCNAFDLVRIHKFGELDEDVAPDIAGTKLPSYKAMIELALKDEETGVTVLKDKEQEAQEDFSDNPDESDSRWKGKLSRNKKGIESSLENLLLIMQCDPRLKGIVFNQMADNLEIKDNVPWKHPNKFWRDADDAQLEAHLANNYTEFPKVKIKSAVTKVADDRSYHPVREYLDSLPEWDGVPRVDTLLIDYLGAEDDEYVRAVTRKTLCGAVARVKIPGCKFDTMLVLNGPQGVGKSTLVYKLGGEWFTDSLSLSDMKDKTAAEKLQGYWIVEIGELAGMRKMDVETIKAFLSRQDDKYRASYGYRVSSHPRQCIAIGTTNAEDGFLRDVTGGRRFWPVITPGKGIKKVWDMTEGEVQQIWAEVLTLYEKEKLFLDEESVKEKAEKAQREALEADSRQGIIENYLNKKLPADWNKKNLYERQSYYNPRNEFEEEESEGDIERTEVCIQEILCECFGRDLGNGDRRISFEIAAIMEKIPGWEKTGKLKKFKLYGPQKVYTRINEKLEKKMGN